MEILCTEGQCAVLGWRLFSNEQTAAPSTTSRVGTAVHMVKGGGEQGGVNEEMDGGRLVDGARHSQRHTPLFPYVTIAAPDA